jgi:hypothetical protein
MDNHQHPQNQQHNYPMGHGYASPSDLNKAFNIKDVVIILTFLAGIAGIYTNVNERLVKLETKGDLIAQQLAEIKSDTAKLTNKLDESLKTLTFQLRDLENLVISKQIKK